MSYLRLIKLIYIADRETVSETGKPISGGRQVVMDHGPVHSRMLDMIHGIDICSPDWQQFICREGYQVKLVRDPGIDRLTKYEARKLEDVFARFADSDDWEIVRHTHDFPEVVKNRPQSGSVKDIPLEDLLEAVGLSSSAASIVADIEAATRVGAVLRGR